MRRTAQVESAFRYSQREADFSDVRPGDGAGLPSMRSRDRGDDRQAQRIEGFIDSHPSIGSEEHAASIH